MEPLTTEQESLLDDHNNRTEEDKHESQDGSVEQSTTVLDIDPSSNPDSKHNDSAEMDSETRDAGVTNIAPIQQDLENESTTNHISVDPEVVPESPDSLISSASSSISEDAYFPSQKAEPFNAPAETNPSLFSEHMTNLNNDEQEDLSGAQEAVNPNSSSDMSQGQPTTLSISLSSQSDAVVEPNVINDTPIEATNTSSAENFGLDKIQEGSAEGDKLSLEVHGIIQTEPPGTTMPTNVSHAFANEEPGNVSEYMNESRQQLRPSSPEDSITSVGIPAPTVVPAALQAAPGKVLVPAIVDQVQGQALAALQALKVCVDIPGVIVTSLLGVLQILMFQD